MTETDFAIETEQVAKDVDGIPYCTKHHCRMTRASGGKKDSPTVYYKCPVPKCDCRQQIVKVKESFVPREPLKCPRCKDICERDDKNSNAQAVILQCPKCKWKSTALATPQFANLRERQRRMPEVEELGAR